jgi:methyl-accepting chemotaxis protein
MSSPNDDLRSTIEAVHDHAEQIEDLEEQKAKLDPADPRMVSLSDQVQRVASDLKDLANAERDLSEEAQA